MLYLRATLSFTADQILVATNSTRRRAKGNTEASNPDNAWRLSDFDHSTWLSGPAPFFYGEPLTPGTLITDMSSNYR